MMGLRHRCLYSLTALLQILVCSLIAYALIIGSGDIIANGCQKIGFFNYCFYYSNISGCQCITHVNLGREVAHYGYCLVIFLTYSSLVMTMFGILTLILTLFTQDCNLRKLTLVLNVLSLLGLFLGMMIHLCSTWNLFNISQVTPGFWALLGALGGMCLLCWIIGAVLLFDVKGMWSHPTPTPQLMKPLTPSTQHFSASESTALVPGNRNKEMSP